jgi:hypothetical protein
MFLALTFATLLGLGSLVAIGPTVSEVQSAGKQLRDKRAFFQADGGATLCRGELKNRLQRALAARLASLTSLTDVASYVTTNDPAGFLAQYAYQSGTSYGGAFIKDSTTQARLPLAYTPSGAPGSYNCTVTVISRTAPFNQGSGLAPQYLFRYRYSSSGNASEGGLSHTVNLQGIFSVLVQQDNFARYALFTNQQMDASGATVWFTNRTNFTGPVHTNGRFNFALNPGANFTGLVDSVSTTAQFYNSGFPIQLDANNNGSLDVPTFGAGFNRGSGNIAMPATTTADNQRDAALGLPMGTPVSGYSNGVYVGTSGGAMTGGIYVHGDASISLGVASPGVAGYSIVQGGITTTVTVNYAANQTTVQQGSSPATNYTGVPNGMLYVDGTVNSLAGTVQRDTQLTVAATNDVQITNNVTYENYTAGSPPSAEGTNNVLGVLSWNGNVRITSAAPNDITIDATVMAPNGQFTVDNYSSGYPRGTATLLGGVIENTYGAFGTFSGSTQTTGYGRNFVYDTRMGRGMAPPFFPTIGNVISSVAGVNDRPNWQQTN